MKRQFPIFVLNIEVPPDTVDVNVHPNKLEIKFANADAVKRIIYKTVKQTIDELTLIPKKIESELPTSNTNSIHIEQLDIEHIGKTDFDKAAGPQKTEQYSLGTFFTLEKKSQALKINSPSSDTYDDETRNIDSLYTNSDNAPQIETAQPKSNESPNFNTNNFKTILFDTYIVLEKDDLVLLIDQHAAHERVLYDKLLKSYETGNIYSQDMLVPYIFTVTPIESELLKNRIDEINSCGFTLSELSGRTYSLSAVPLICAGLENERFVSMILDGLNKLKYKKSDFVKDILMQAACKAAVKGTDKLHDTEINYLLNQYTQNNKVLLCPHGRPLIIQITKSEIEKWFKRTV